MIRLGDVSFSVYLLRRIVQVGLVLHLTGTELAPLVTGGGFFIGSTAITLVLAHASYVWLERGLAERVRRWLLRRLGLEASSDRDRPRLPSSS